MNDKITLSKNDARKLYWDVFTSNLLFIALAAHILVTSPWLWLQIVIGIFIASVVFDIFQAKKVLVPGGLFKRKKVKRNDGNKGT